MLPRHPAGDDLVGAAFVKTVQTLDGHDQPLLRAGDCAPPARLHFRRFTVAVKADEHWRRTAIGRRLDEVASVGGGANRALFHRRAHQITFTTPEPRMSVSRVISGKPAVTADAQMSASNGSRVKGSSSAT